MDLAKQTHKQANKPKQTSKSKQTNKQKIPFLYKVRLVPGFKVVSRFILSYISFNSETRNYLF